MESIAALGLACNIFQIISFGNETIRLVRDVYSRGFLETPLAEHAVTLRDVASHIIAFETPVNPRKYEVQLKDNATKCHAVARDLVEEIKFLLSERAKGDLAGTLKVVSKMQTGLLVRVCDRIDAIGAKQRTLNEDVHRLIQQYGSGETQASKLISEYSNLTRDQISLKAVELQCQINNDIGQSQNDIIVNIEKAVESFSTQTVSHMTKLEFSREKAEQKALFINSLTFSGMNERRNQVSEGHEGTSQWIFYRSEPDLEGSWKGLYGEAKNQGIGEKDSVRPWDNFSDWLQSNEQIYWISGKPGSGKTTMAKYILSHPMTKRLLDSWKPDFMMVSHFFWRPGSTLQQNIKGMVASILYQLLRNSQLSTDLAMCNVHDITEKRPDGVCGNWSLAELKQTTATVLEQHERPVFVLIDGVDEVTPSDGVSDLLLMIEDLYKRPNAKLCILSRPVAWVQRSLAGYPSLRISDFTAGDISRYTHDKLVKSFEDLQGHSPSLSFAQVKLLIRQLVNKAEGSFLWLHLSLNSVVRGIQQGDEFNSLQARIFSLPETISDQYKEMWKQHSPFNLGLPLY
ncbi:hypothetical protein CGMCC3_g10180 [Colletotrichum fructicola]|nr:uncharacterized protein CGMCC3_g10180 [Colletotrichum fructicola]KAE9573785.1 hypothetical protein CGMCC3_g10180 [Colletotrichum fructicola]